MGEAAKKDEETEEQLVPVGPGADDLPEEKAPRKNADEDERLAQKDDEPEAKPGEPAERHKETSKERRDRAKKRLQRERTEMEELRRKNLELERRFVAMETRQASTETSAIDQRITQVSAQVSNAGRVMAEALKKPNGAGAEEFEEAQRIRDELRDQLAELKASKKQHVQHVEERQVERQASRDEGAKPDPRVLRKARDWASENDWFQFDGDDEDSAIVRAIDVSLSQAGFDPATSEYWEELTERVKRRLPEKFKKGAQKARRDEDDEMDDDEDDEREEREVRSTGPKFSSGGRERPLKKGEVYVSAERKAAMKEYGVWDDPKERNRMLKKYAKWDAENASKR